jgi:hypothetical protein
MAAVDRRRRAHLQAVPDDEVHEAGVAPRDAGEQVHDPVEDVVQVGGGRDQADGGREGLVLDAELVQLVRWRAVNAAARHPTS